ncbi:MAG: anhydro-N-acetylmuramic acid kinase [Sphingobacteriales bacterium]|nr:MAG: anhydro-N-acetylmuramic acid kinase [Sphingobacteriales bacterium]
MKTYRIIGLMSGTSLDGLDIADCTFSYYRKRWRYRIHHATCIEYSDEWRERLATLIDKDLTTYLATDAEYGVYLGTLVNQFIEAHNLAGKIQIIASHGQTIIHRPDLHFSAQIGNGAAIAETTKLPVICNLRANDIAAGGQGAPVVPFTDLHLFLKHRFCLNLGGIANISCKLTGNRIIGYDICPNNLILNNLAHQLGYPYDNGGNLAAAGNIDSGLLDALNGLPYYRQPYPKSLDARFVPQILMPLLLNFRLPVQDKLRTIVEHIAIQTGLQTTLINQQESIDPQTQNSMLITGGGAFNTFLISRIATFSGCNIIVPDSLTINYKEALAMAFMAVLRLQCQPNCLSSVTGATHNTVGGCVYYASQ